MGEAAGCHLGPGGPPAATAAAVAAAAAARAEGPGTPPATIDGVVTGMSGPEVPASEVGRPGGIRGRRADARGEPFTPKASASFSAACFSLASASTTASSMASDRLSGKTSSNDIRAA